MLVTSENFWRVGARPLFAMFTGRWLAIVMKPTVRSDHSADTRSFQFFVGEVL